MQINYFKLVTSIIVCQLAGIIGSLFTSSITTWYVTLNKPFFNPPSWLFGPVWTALYLLMGISLYIIWNENSKNVKLWIFFFAQLILNALWSIIFFGLRNPLWAFVDIVVLWVFILLTIIYFYRVSKTASYLLIPYILWVSFAAVLNLAILILN